MIGLISDIHGNYSALSTVLSALQGMGVEDIICLGDVAGYYSQINECCDALRERDIPVLQGNHDFYLTRNVPCPRSNSANRCLDYQRQNIRDDNMAWLATKQPRDFWHGINVVHGGWNDPLDEYLVPAASYFAPLEGRVFASGHTHVQLAWQCEGKTYCNPGSVGQPRDGNPAAAFATWDGSRFSLHRIAYDIDNVHQAMAKAGFTRYFSENLELGAMIGGNILPVPVSPQGTVQTAYP